MIVFLKEPNDPQSLCEKINPTIYSIGGSPYIPSIVNTLAYCFKDDLSKVTLSFQLSVTEAEVFTVISSPGF